LKLVFINPLPTSKIFGQKVDAWWYQKHGFEVEFWDISPIFWSREKRAQYYGGAEDYRYVGPGHKVFSTRKETLKAIGGLGNRAVIWHLGWNLNRISRKDDWLLDAIKETGIPLFITQFETDPARFGPAQIATWARARMVRMGFAGREPKGFIGCGTVARRRAAQILPDTDFISIPSPKILWKKSSPPLEPPYAVFVDENVEYAPDAKMLGYTVSSDVDGYYRRMNAAFRAVEDALGCPVVIAASGKYRYPEDRFMGRRLLYGRTLPLIQHARLVIGHCSAALDQAVVDRKPLLRLDDPSFGREKRANIRYSVQLLGVEAVRADDLNGIRRAVAAAACDERHCAEVEAKYFREPGVHGDYREIIKQAFLSV